MKVDVIVAPTNPLVVQSVYNHLRQLGTPLDSAQIAEVIDDVFAFGESELDASLATQTLEATYWAEDGRSCNSGQMGRRLDLPNGPVQSITSVTVGTTVLDPSAYTLKRMGTLDFVDVATNSTAPIVVLYVAGYTTLPNDLRRAMYNTIGTYYSVRETIGTVQLISQPIQADRIWAKYKRGSIAK